MNDLESQPRQVSSEDYVRGQVDRTLVRTAPSANRGRSTSDSTRTHPMSAVLPSFLLKERYEQDQHSDQPLPFLKVVALLDDSGLRHRTPTTRRKRVRYDFRFPIGAEPIGHSVTLSTRFIFSHGFRDPVYQGRLKPGK